MQAVHSRSARTRSRSPEPEIKVAGPQDGGLSRRRRGGREGVGGGENRIGSEASSSHDDEDRSGDVFHGRGGGRRPNNGHARVRHYSGQNGGDGQARGLPSVLLRPPSLQRTNFGSASSMNFHSVASENFESAVETSADFDDPNFSGSLRNGGSVNNTFVPTVGCETTNNFGVSTSPSGGGGLRQRTNIASISSSRGNESRMGDEDADAEKSRLKSTRDITAVEAEIFRRKLQFYFWDPIQKYNARKKIPFKLLIQIVKCFVGLCLIVNFGNFRESHANFINDSEIGFKHLFLQDWDAVREIHAYPPSTGAYAIYRREPFYDYFDHVSETFHDLAKIAVTSIFPKDELGFCIVLIERGKILPNLTVIGGDPLNPVERTECIQIPIADLKGMNSSKYLPENKMVIPWDDSLQGMFINFTAQTMTFAQLGPLEGPSCFEFKTKILFDNSDYDVQMPIDLQFEPIRKECPNQVYYSTDESVWIQFLNYLLPVICFTSLILCCRAIIRAQILRREAQVFFKSYLDWEMSRYEHFEFLNLWYIVIIINDTCLITGCIMKEIIETSSSFDVFLWDVCASFLGVGILLVAVGSIRYLGFFDKYNILIVTVRNAAPNVLRFLLCGSLIYVGFVLCGWIVMSPYHYKFRSVFTTSDCLFSLINGDDMFATFSSFPFGAGFVKIFGRIFLYIFICVFIYVILSVFISIIMEQYENVRGDDKKHLRQPQGRIHDWYRLAAYEPNPRLFRFDKLNKEDHNPDDSENLIAPDDPELYDNEIVGLWRKVTSCCCGGRRRPVVVEGLLPSSSTNQPGESTPLLA